MLGICFGYNICGCYAVSLALCKGFIQESIVQPFAKVTFFPCYIRKYVVELLTVEPAFADEQSFSFPYIKDDPFDLFSSVIAVIVLFIRTEGVDVADIII